MDSSRFMTVTKLFVSSAAVRGGTSMKVTTIGLDVAKQIFQVHGADAEGQVVLRKRLRRSQVAAFFANLLPCVVGLEASGGSHYWSRALSRFGHTAFGDRSPVCEALREIQQERRQRRRSHL